MPPLSVKPSNHCRLYDDFPQNFPENNGRYWSLSFFNISHLLGVYGVISIDSKPDYDVGDEMGGEMHFNG